MDACTALIAEAGKCFGTIPAIRCSHPLSAPSRCLRIPHTLTFPATLLLQWEPEEVHSLRST